MNNLNTSILSALPLRIPTLPIQARIAEALNCVEDCIAATRRVIDQTAVVKEGFLRRLLSRGLAPARVPPAEEDPERPAQWRWRRLGELCSFTNGKGFKASQWSSHGLPIIRIQNLNGSREFNHYAGMPKAGWIVEEGDLLFAWAGVKGVSFGPHIWRGPRGVLNQHIYRVRPREDVEPRWLFETLKLVTRDIEEKAQGFKSSLQHVRKADITAFPILVPPYSEQQSIAEHCSSVAEMEAMEISNLEAVLKLKCALMDDLFSGRVQVS